MTTWFSADFHYGHKNIIKFCNRPFATVEEMDEVLISNWNKKVGKFEHAWIIGDFCFNDKNKGQEILNRMNGIKHLVRGNHDSTSVKLDGWASISDYEEMKIGSQKIILSHYAMRVWNGSHYGSWQLYGHSHGTLPDDPNLLSFDVGVDCHNFSPLSVEDIAAIMTTKTWTPPFEKRE
jgi:calcineurin-like phosphoesterase family protein